MARRSLLTGDERRKLFEPPVTEREVARFYTLSPDDLNWIDERNSPANKLGAAVQLALLRHPGFGWLAGQIAPPPVLRFLSLQVHVQTEALGDYGKRPKTRSEHAGQLHERLGLRAFVRSDLRQAVSTRIRQDRTAKAAPLAWAARAGLDGEWIWTRLPRSLRP